ncbi:hypothetical protein CHS0354_027757 [Potamilus streckersoni]|uniref:Cyclin B n=1 Tax=Potamilus streckersoni TaxID=2493646 RepID=A0AAE0W5Z0_9BIVA|nr:hypothetical protein CHS0354_027757 [Potamilus streckersoni]
MALNTKAAPISQLVNPKMAVSINRENTDVIMLSKMQRPNTALANHRAALGDIGNKVSAITLDGSKKAAVKKEIIQTTAGTKQKTLSKAKATSSLKNLVEVDNNVVEKQDQFAPFQFVGPSVSKTTSSFSQQTVISVTVAEPSKTCVLFSAPMDIGEDKPEAFSKALLKVEDIDANDKDNPQLVSEYVNDIYEYMRLLEQKYSVRPNYLEGQEITGKMRAILIDWLCQVHHRFRLLQETLFLTVTIIDRFLQIHPVVRNKLQLVGVTSMLIASKYEEMYAPEVADFVYITDNAYTKKDIQNMECTILRTLDFRLGKPLCLHFLRRNSKAGQVDANKHTLAKYLMELTITEYEMVQCLPSQVAAGALCLAMKLLDGSKWTDTLRHYSSYTEEEIMPTIQKLASLVAKAETSKLTAVKTKYSSSKFMKISSIPELKSQSLKDLAAACTNGS